MSFLRPNRADGWWYVFVTAVVTFVAAPASFLQKAHLVLGGLCAQRPSHSFVFDGTHLPMDARMTGIYLGSLTAMVILLVLGRIHHAGSFSVWSWSVIAALFGSMAIDGMNSLLVDLGRWHLYTPDNRLRLATGLLAGVGLGAMLIFLVSSSVWAKEARRARPLVREGELVGIVVAAMLVGFVILAGGDWLLGPLTLLLLVSAMVTVTVLALVCLAIIQAPCGLATARSELTIHVPRAAALGITVMLGLAAVRFVAEQWLGPLDRM